MGGSADPGVLAELEAKLSSNTKDHQARHDLSLALFGQQRYGEAFGHALDIVKMDKEWEGGRELLFKFFDTLGNAHPEVLKARRRMASLLF